MATVRQATHELLAAHGLTTIFGNPGSNELPFLKDLPAGFRYVLGLHEGSVIGMADGYAQATGRPAFVNLHAASGTGNAMGALTNAAYSRTPLVITAGQQVRTVIGLEGMLANVDAAQLTRPLTGFAAEPACASDVPRTLAQALFEARIGRRGPAYVSVPYDDWDADCPSGSAVVQRHVQAFQELSEGARDELVRRVTSAERPALVLGCDLDGLVSFADLVELAERLDCPVHVAPSAWRLPFPNRHRLFRGVLPAGIASVATALAGHDLVLALGCPVFRYHQHEPGDYLRPGTSLVQITDDPHAAARAPFGESIVTDPAGAVTALLVGLPPASGPARDRWTRPAPPLETPGVNTPAAVFATLRDTLPEDTVYVVESTSTNADWWAQMDLRHPGSYYFPASGGLGFGIPAAVGVALAEADRRLADERPRRVVGVIGDGSANYGIQALWTAAQLGLPVTIVVLRNGTYAALRWFAGLLGTPDAPGMDVPGIDFVSLATGYGVPAVAAGTIADLARLLADEPTAPLLIQIDTAVTRPDGQPLEENR